MSNKPWVGKTVVIIDDSAGVRQELKQAYEACGLKVVAMAENGVSGLEQVKAHRPEIASIDIIMPEMDGVECFRKIQAFDAKIQCIVVSWLAGEVKIQENLKEYIPAHLFQAKPLTAHDLESRLTKVYFPEHRDKPPGPKHGHEEPVVAEKAVDDDIFGDLGVKVS